MPNTNHRLGSAKDTKMAGFINRLCCLAAATASAYFANMIYELNTAFAWESPTCRPIGTSSCQTSIRYGQCFGHSTCTAVDAAIRSIDTTPPSGYMFGGCTGEVVQMYYSVRASCGFVSCGRVSVYPTMVEREAGCGMAKVCNGTVEELSCYTAPTGSAPVAGWHKPNPTGQATWCTCCSYFNASAMAPASLISVQIRSIYGAAAASDCYMVGTFRDESGLFEFTDDNRCYY